MRFLLAFFLCISTLNSQVTKNRGLPNIIYILADDLGKGLLSNYGQKIINTPNIDKLAKEGMSFNNAYAGMVCAPSRASLISGLQDCHLESFQITRGGLYKSISKGKQSFEQIQEKLEQVLKPESKEHVYLGQVAQRAGYKTGQFGKLEWGFSATHKQMVDHGWDEYYGYLDHVRAHGFYPPFLIRNGVVEKIEGNTRVDCGKSKENETPEKYKERWNMNGKEIYSQQLFMDNVLNFITKNKDNPFFLYFPTQLPHGPVAVSEVHSDFIDNQNLTPIEKEYASMVKMLDDNVGQIMKHLSELGIDENTMVIFTSDNGHEIYYSQKGRITKPTTNINTGERFDNITSKYYSELAGDVFNGNAGRAGLKRSNLQGGIEVPLIVRWPKKIAQGVESNLLVANYDFLSTLSEIVGSKETLNTDGLSYYKELLGQENSKVHESVAYSSFTGPTLITQDGWKLRTYLNENLFELYNLSDDYKEEHNLSEQYPDKVEKLKKELLVACAGDFNNGWYGNKKRKKK